MGPGEADPLFIMSLSVPNRTTIACLGEILWDVLPRGIFLGGAPLNVAYHLSRQGLRALPVSAIGRDFLGGEVRRRMQLWGVDASGVADAARRPTGTVLATLDARGVARYRFAADVAWDRIAVPPALQRQPPPVAVVFGTLALREPPNRRVLDRLVTAWPATLRVLDLNLRPPFDGADAIAFALARAQLLKLNDDELGRVMSAPTRTKLQLAAAARRLGERHGLRRICVTAGARGAGLWWDGAWYWESGRPVTVRDTIGSGDAFLAGLLGSLLHRGAGPRQALATACRLGEFVATRDGATPDYEWTAANRPR